MVSPLRSLAIAAAYVGEDKRPIAVTLDLEPVIFEPDLPLRSPPTLAFALLVKLQLDNSESPILKKWKS